MAVYFVIGAVIVAWALVLCFGGMARVKNFPDTRQGRLLIIASGVLCLGAFIALIATTEKEHPREEAKAEAAVQAAERKVGGVPVEAQESEYKIKLATTKLNSSGKVTFDVKNEGKIAHDLAVEGPGTERKTALIDPGKDAKLLVDLTQGKYKLYCTVPGHEQLGMKTELTVR